MDTVTAMSLGSGSKGDDECHVWIHSAPRTQLPPGETVRGEEAVIVGELLASTGETRKTNL